MKVLFYLILPFTLLLGGCDIVEEPYMNQIDDDPSNGETIQKVLLEEFTGHQCPNCPAGAQIATQLHDFYGDKFVIIAYHAGWFARTSTQFPVDYRTEVGEELNTHFQVSAYPSGMVNRTLVNSNILVSPSGWGSAASTILENDPAVKITISKLFNPDNRNLSVSATVKSLGENNALKVCIFITENNLVSPQKITSDETYPEGIIYDYVHNHVFRTSLNGTWGTEIFAQGAAEGETQLVTAEGILNSGWEVNNLEIVCFAYNSISGEIIQVETKSVI